MDDEDDYIFFGTSLPDIDDEFTLRKKAVQELQVRDEKGRQRFHGAFTGGFSAGYFNTVGTKEGWAPSSFVSSRSKKVAERLAQCPEDFMDDEDFGEFGIASRRIHTTSNFQGDSNRDSRKRKFFDTDAVIPGEAPLIGIIRPVNESIGIKILTKMGWKLGQGIGPRVKKQSNNVKVYGCSLPEIEEDDPFMVQFTFAPKDVGVLSYQPKNDLFGLGYTGLSKKSVLAAPVDLFAPTSTKSWLSKDKKKLTITGQAFGVGAFEDDDEDIYSKDDMSQYDFTDITNPMKEVEDDDSEPKNSSKPAPDRILQGFCLALKTSVIKKHYPPPKLPPDFKPIRKALCGASEILVQHKRPHHSLSAEERSVMLGEKKFITSVDVMIKETKAPDWKEKLQTLKFTSGSEFQPFAYDTDKQKRYEQFIKLQNSEEVERLAQPSSMTAWEKQQELEEFNKASTFYKPMSQVLSNRFESRSHLSLEHEVMNALQKEKSPQDKPSTTVKKSIGSSDRKEHEWHPSSLLCKRFNVPNPYPNSDLVDVPNSAKPKHSLFDHLTFETRSEVTEIKEIKDEKKSQVEELKPVANTSKPVEDTPTESKKPPIDFFKDIFENSSSEDEDEQSLTETKNSEPLSEATKRDEINVQAAAVEETEPTQNKRPAFGVFANLDLDALNQRGSSDKINIVNKDDVEGSNNGEKNNDVNTASDDKVDNSNTMETEEALDDFYGPALPPDFSAYSQPFADSPSKKHLKHKHKHKHHKHKKNKKKKSSKHAESSYSSNEHDDEDIPPEVIIEKLKKLQKK